ncbi:uncharacterized protein LOC134261973 [Saccostrea cucullata]|uniref:uncharacterized protein LOC134261973 n=1 Tax=Saccostrea cuccullata TaxID=36930 RepID=UPI002ED35720
MTFIWNSVIFLVHVTCVLQTILNSARALCLRDILKFYYSEEACSFNKTRFTEVFKENQRACFVNCSMISGYSKKDNGPYEIEKMEIIFSTTYNFTMFKPCGTFDNTDAYITVTCGEKIFNERRVGEYCTNSTQCTQGNPDTTCNKTTGVCECKDGYIMRFNNCFQGELSLNESCEINEQCSKTPEYLFCSQNNSRKACLSLPEPKVNAHKSDESMEEKDLGSFIGVGIGGFVLGVTVCGVLFINRNSCKKKEDHESQEVSATQSYCPEEGNAGEFKEERGKPQIKVADKLSYGTSYEINNVLQSDIYNHLHEDTHASETVSDYDHAPFNDPEGDTYNHLLIT